MRLDPRALARLRAICLSLPETSETVSWGHPTFRAGKKTFAVLEEYGGSLTVAFKAGLLDQDALLNDPRFFATPYIGQRGWVSLKLDGRPDWKEIERLVVRSYRLVALKRMLAALESRGRG